MITAIDRALDTTAPVGRPAGERARQAIVHTRTASVKKLTRPGDSTDDDGRSTHGGRRGPR